MIRTTNSKRLDENNADGLAKQVKKMPLAGSVAGEAPKRTALGVLSNRVELRTNVKDAEQKSLKEGKQSALAAVKPRVDSHWKKPLVATTKTVSKGTTGGRSTTTTTTTTTTTAAAAAAGAVGAIRANLANHASKIARPVVPRTAADLRAKTTDLKDSKTKVLAKSTLKTESAATTGSVNDRTTTTTTTTLNVQRKETNVSNLNPVTKVRTAITSTSTTLTKIETVSINNVKVQTTCDEKALVKASVNQCSELEESYIDIDKDDGDNILMMSEYVNDIYKYLNQLEDMQSVDEDHLRNQLEVTSRMRGILMDWINEVQVQFNLLDESFQLAVGMIDRYLQIVNTTKRKQLQLVGVTALFMAVKYEELFPPAISDFVYITDDAYTSKQIFDMEMEMFKVLDFNLSRPLPIHFLRRFAKAAKTTETQYVMTKYFTELALLDYSTAHYKPSKMAGAALLLSLYLTQVKSQAIAGISEKEKCWTPTLKHYSGYEVSDLWSTSLKIAELVRNAPESKLKSVYTKYNREMFHRMLYKEEMYNGILDAILGNKVTQLTLNYH